MQISAGVEWAAHACALLAALPENRVLPADAIAAFHEVPPAYMAKQLQALSRAGITLTRRGAAGGYRLKHAPVAISLLDIHEAVEGRQPAFRCQEIRQNGPCANPAEACRTPCAIAAAFLAAETAFRQSLKQVSLADILIGVIGNYRHEDRDKLAAWIDERALPARR